MTIRSKFLLLICFIILCFTVIILFDVLYSNEMSKFISLKDKGYDAITNLYTLNISTRDLLYTQYLDRAYRDWEGEKAKNEKAIGEFLHSEYLLFFVRNNMKIAMDYNLTLDNWNFIQKQLDEIRLQFKAGVPGDISAKRGINYIMEEQVGNTEIFNLYTLTNRIVQNLTGSILGYFVAVYHDINNEVDRIEAVYITIKYVMVGCIIIILLVVFYFFSTSLNSRLRSIEVILKSLSERDFSPDIQIKGKDEIARFGQYIRMSIHNLNDIFNKIKSYSNRTSSLSDSVTVELTSSSKSLNDITENIKSIKDEFENLKNNILTSSNSSQEIQNNLNALSDQMHTQASTIVESSVSTEEVIASISNISKVVEARRESAIRLIDEIRSRDVDMNETDVKIQEIRKNMERIQEVATIINGIAGQINLLSLNAAIEAAHAGEAGKGFSIVADEIRKLADSTNSNSKQIGSYIDKIASMIHHTSEISKKNLDSNKSTVEEVVKFIQLFEEISGGLHEMSAGSSEILKVNQILNNLTNTVTGKYKTILADNQSISTAISNLNQITANIFNGISVMYEKAAMIAQITDSISEKQNDSSSGMREMNQELVKFKT